MAENDCGGILLAAGAVLGCSGMLYCFYREKRRTVDKLKYAPLLTLDGRLADMVRTGLGNRWPYVVVEGTVQPVGEPLRSRFQEGTVGVVHREWLTELSRVWRSQSWSRSQRVLHDRVNSVDFSLLGSDRATAVRVLYPPNLTSLLNVTHKKSHPATYGQVKRKGGAIAPFVTQTIETEQMLKVGYRLTGVGELILDTDGVLKLRPPADGSRYFLTWMDVHTLRAEQKEEAAVLWWMAAVLGVAGGGILFLGAGSCSL